MNYLIRSAAGELVALCNHTSELACHPGCHLEYPDGTAVTHRPAPAPGTVGLPASGPLHGAPTTGREAGPDTTGVEVPATPTPAGPAATIDWSPRGDEPF